MEYEVIDNTKYFKIIRLRSGIIVNIFKYDIGRDINYAIKNTRKDIKKITNKLYEVKHDLVDRYSEDVYEAGDKLYKFNNCCYYKIGNKLDKKDWQWELKTTGDYFSGDTENFRFLIKEILKIIDNESEDINE